MEEGWKWWAGENEEEYDLAGPCDTREEAISVAYGSTEPGDYIFLIEAKFESEPDWYGRYDFIATRNRSNIKRKRDK